MNRSGIHVVLDTISFEHGLTLCNARHSVQIPNCSTIADITAEVTARYGVRPIMHTYDSNSLVTKMAGIQKDCILRPSGNVLDLARLCDAIVLINPMLFHAVQYELVGSLHHCKQLIRQYNVRCAREYYRSRESSCDHVEVVGAHEVYYEFEAILIKCRRALDRIGIALWKVLGSGPPAPKNFSETLIALREIGKAPSDTLTRLECFWAKEGIALKDYRDSVQHFSRLGGPESKVSLSRLDGGIWAMSAPIPDNPDAKMKVHYRYCNRIDALTYAWTITNSVFQVLDVAVDAAVAKVNESNRDGDEE